MPHVVAHIHMHMHTDIHMSPITTHTNVWKHVGTLFQYTYWECWNPIPVHLLGVLEPLGLLQYTHR